jgi:predicted transcriptional regulator
VAIDKAVHDSAVETAQHAIRYSINVGQLDAAALKGAAEAAYKATVHAHSLGDEVKTVTLAHPVEEAVSVDGKTVRCLVCDFTGNMLKRHLRISHGLSPEAYYALVGRRVPLTAPGYTEKRSALAKASGLGKHPKAA